MSYLRIIERAFRILKSNVRSAFETIPAEEQQELKDFEEELKREYERERKRSDRSRQDRGETSGTAGKRTARDYYAVLGLTPDATMEDVSKAYRDIISKYHPDKTTNLGQELQELAAQKSREINEAYQWIKEHQSA
ncbi:MAG: J domain-containing protein [Chlorobi bacterium]|nr:J domain-containing protein [Chlorobiota bacterium]